MLNERSRKILCAVVQSYIEHPVPVGSRTITKKFGISLSPATIRNIMADLEDMGFLSQPHTSAGRVPTDKGYRVYVDGLCGQTAGDYPNIFKEEFKALKDDLSRFLHELTARLSEATHCLAFAATSSADSTTLNRIQLYRYRGNQIATVILTGEGIIKHKIISSGFGLSQKDLARLSDYLNSEFSGYTLSEMRNALVKQMSQEKALYDMLITRVIDICREALSFERDDIYMAGLSEFLSLPDFASKVREVAKAIEDKHTIIRLLDELSSSGAATEKVRVLIGSENPISEMRGMSVVVAPYRWGSRILGSLGIIGPLRMDYRKTISMLETAARSVSEALTEG